MSTRCHLAISGLNVWLRLAALEFFQLQWLDVMECCRLRFKDIDFDNNLIFVWSGKGIRQIQDYLGHSNVETTMVYTHVVKGLRNPAQSPLDMMEA